jgi:hypothetical protein
MEILDRDAERRISRLEWLSNRHGRRLPRVQELADAVRAHPNVHEPAPAEIGRDAEASLLGLHAPAELPAAERPDLDALSAGLPRQCRTQEHVGNEHRDIAGHG